MRSSRSSRSKSRLVDKPLHADYNVAPTKQVYAVLSRRPEEAPDELQRSANCASFGGVWSRRGRRTRPSGRA